ncbi:MAG: hypothetical protein LUG95_03120 [Clostridiales bacterium]|nr:hypothetical protein [Clostridiales bacterium]
MPQTVESIACSVDSLTLSAADCSAVKFDVESLLVGSIVTVTYDMGYTDEVEYTSGVTYRDTEIEYSDTQSESAWSCSSYYCTLSLGDVSTNIPVAIEHSYKSSVVEATYTTKGYTVYTCTLCGDTY